jgi:hypothetical protein
MAKVGILKSRRVHRIIPRLEQGSIRKFANIIRSQMTAAGF